MTDKSPDFNRKNQANLDETGIFQKNQEPRDAPIKDDHAEQPTYSFNGSKSQDPNELIYGNISFKNSNAYFENKIKRIFNQDSRDAPELNKKSQDPLDKDGIFRKKQEPRDSQNKDNSKDQPSYPLTCSKFQGPKDIYGNPMTRSAPIPVPDSIRRRAWQIMRNKDRENDRARGNQSDSD